jgi:hypothetical protein
VSQGTDQDGATELTPWKPPADHFERQLRPDRTERRRRPLTRGPILAIRVTWLLTAIFSVAVFSLGLPAASLWRHEALILPMLLVTNLVWFTPHQLGQLLGLRPPGQRRRSRAASSISSSESSTA